MTELVKKRKVCRGNCSYVKKLIRMTKELKASYEVTAEAKLVLEEKKIAFTDKLRMLKELDDEILNILCGDKNIEEEIDGEIEESENIKAESSSSATATVNTKQVQLPRLKVPTFSIKVHEWQEFWDGNTQLSEVDKCSYLRGLLLAPARSTVQGFALTADNYKAAVDLLTKCYEIATLAEDNNDKKSITNGIWKSFLDVLGGEIALQGYQRKPDREERQQKNGTNHHNWSTMFAGRQSKCAFCNCPGHRHEDCKVKFLWGECVSRGRCTREGQ
ncbi:partial, partial [Paramuricea clavata]